MKTLFNKIEYGFEVEKKGVTPSLFKQVHGAEILEINLRKEQEEDPLKEVPLKKILPEADAAFIFPSNFNNFKRPGFELSVFTADCIPLLFFSEDEKAPLAIAHCGWRGAQKNIARLTYEKLYKKTLSHRSLVQKSAEQTNNQTSPLHIVIGPCILKCCFEVKKDLIESFELAGHKIGGYLEKYSPKNNNGKISSNEKVFFDLVRFVKETQLGRDENHAIVFHEEMLRCTVCSKPRLPSYRRDRVTDPRIRTWLRAT